MADDLPDCPRCGRRDVQLSDPGTLWSGPVLMPGETSWRCARCEVDFIVAAVPQEATDVEHPAR